jgi:hypothetical protein
MVRQEQPFNAETPLNLLRHDFVTPGELFYVREHGSLPAVDPASLEEHSNHPTAWCFWEASLDLAPGAYRIVARATESAGDTQPETIEEVWNFLGYANIAWYLVNVRAEG